MKKMKDYNYHIGLKLRIYPSDKQKKIIKMNGGASRYIYNKLVADNNEIYELKKSSSFSSADKDRLEFLCKENPYMFFDILPYAYVFGISDIWIKKFESIIIKMPPSYNFDCDIVDVLIMNNICNSMNSVNSSLRDFRAKTIASKVSKTVASGAKGGRSGGGFSGGGFGGGGGGSW